MTLPADIFTSVSIEEALELQRLAEDKTVLEIGTWAGYSAIAMAQTARQVHTVDWHLGDAHAGQQETLPELWKNVMRYGLRDKIVIHVGRSEEVLPFLRDFAFDMVFIDGYHRIDEVLADINYALRVVKVGGIWAFHDYGDERFDVTEAVDAFYPGMIKVVGTLAVIESQT
jgi:predicted O-methyltransferase YrrM